MFNNKVIHMIGIGGISMSGIAEILLSFDNCKVTGYDLQMTSITENLKNKGISISYNYNLKMVEEADIIVYTAAIKDDNLELQHAKKLKKEIYERSTFLGLLMKLYENVFCISGTHGKSTTTGMVSTIFLNAKFDPTIEIGAIMPKINGNCFVGGKKYFIAEACEYVDSFLDFYPTSAIILNIDDDHLDYFKNINNIIKSFNKFALLTKNKGYVIANNDDNNTKMAVEGLNNIITFGINNESNFMAKEIVYNDLGNPSYDLYINNVYITNISLNIKGIHNIYNSLAAIALSYQYIKDIKVIKDSLFEYSGVDRRFEYKGVCNGAEVYDDYAHHPSELETTYNSALSFKNKNKIAVFQPHTYSRTAEHLNRFGQILSKFDKVIIAPIYAAREVNTFGINEDMLVDEIKKNGNTNCIYLDSYDKIADYLKKHISKDDIVVTIGAGPVNQVAEKIVNN